VVNISAPTARIALPFVAALSASKAGLVALSDALRLELAPWHIPVTVVEPGGTDTQIFAKAAAGERTALGAATADRAALYQAAIAAVAAAQASQRLAAAEPVARIIASALAARSPRRHYAAGREARLAGLLVALPAGLRERLISQVLGLPGAVGQSAGETAGRAPGAQEPGRD
jgi:NAD(P)-dependent dehydrogenase (short-subunit alcohol dehydrogenase family)